jgi:hypothetical protein
MKAVTRTSRAPLVLPFSQNAEGPVAHRISCRVMVRPRAGIFRESSERYADLTRVDGGPVGPGPTGRRSGIDGPGPGPG